MTSTKPIAQASSPTLRDSWPALLRAAQRARALPIQTGTALVICRNGVIEHIHPEPAPAGTQVQEPPAPYGDNA